MLNFADGTTKNAHIWYQTEKKIIEKYKKENGSYLVYTPGGASPHALGPKLTIPTWILIIMLMNTQYC